MMNTVNKIVKKGLCLGCGLCESIATSSKCKMELNERTGFYEPNFYLNLTKTQKRKLMSVCPSVNISGQNETTVWGNIKKIEEAWATDPLTRQLSSSGGVVTTLTILLLENKMVDGILHVGVDNDTYLYNSLKVSKTKSDVIKNMGSRYAPALILNHIKLILDSSDELYAFVGKPCDIAGIKNFLKEFPEYQKRIKYFIAIFCAGMPSYNGTKDLLKLSKNNDEPIAIKYRGDGWPGYFEAKYNSSESFKISYNDSWGKVLNKHLNSRCKICPDGIGLLADIVVGDSWATKDGYPDFNETEGKSFVMIRTENGLELYSESVQQKVIQNKDFNIETLQQIQPYQYYRRVYSGYRLIFIQLLTGYGLKFKGLGIVKIMSKGKVHTGLRNALGSLRRFVR